MTVEEVIEELQKMVKRNPKTATRPLVLPANRFDGHTEVTSIFKDFLHIDGLEDDPKTRVIVMEGDW